MEPNSSNLYIITGGPGSGKTTLLEELSKENFITAPEEGRRIIKEQLISHGTGLPWIDRKYFAELMFEASLKTYEKMRSISAAEAIFFDRGILDTLGYLKLENILVPEEMEIKAKELIYQKNVFILPPWKEIYQNDEERKQTFEVAIATFECMKEIYLEYGYHVIEVPKITAEERTQFIMEFIKRKS
ncbi:ATPase [Chryseobacterium lactis]|uniref:ATPase n=1 Tax=Chryseobacterium lactis TaxID=1241981 RepID=A0A3G6RL04_CHRLC|nr:AAA family ATPase [Chryseobacterium lactis]AZA83252.1 ATPase [Chryseobacterium lactis]AZB03637.1 ATPase [Chryseobacterium lactis]PNW11153.1 ATPase [Chryseobacterium lactis]